MGSIGGQGLSDPGKDTLSNPNVNKAWRDLSASSGDLEQFKATGVSNADLLRSAGRWDSQGKLYNWQTKSGQDLTDLVNQFDAWRGKQAKTDQEHKDYVTQALSSPGRDSTILGAPLRRTIL